MTPFAGVLLDLNDNLTAYASYSDIFTRKAITAMKPARRSNRW